MRRIEAGLYGFLANDRASVGLSILIRRHPVYAPERKIRYLIASQFRPAGRQAHYSNQNYYLLGAIIEAASGQSYPDYVTDNILRPPTPPRVASPIERVATRVRWMRFWQERAGEIASKHQPLRQFPEPEPGSLLGSTGAHGIGGLFLP